MMIQSKVHGRQVLLQVSSPLPLPFPRACQPAPRGQMRRSHMRANSEGVVVLACAAAGVR